MISFEYVIKEPVGIHARPAGMLNKEARKYKSAIVVHKGISCPIKKSPPSDSDSNTSTLSWKCSLSIRQVAS